VSQIGDSPHSAKLLTILQSLSVFDHAGPSRYHMFICTFQPIQSCLLISCFSSQQWEIVEQVSLALGSLDTTVSDVQGIINSWQRRISSILTSDSSSTRNSATQTCDELFTGLAKHLQHKGQRKRLGIKKRISVLLGIGQSTKESSAAEINGENVDGGCGRRHKKNAASYKSSKQCLSLVICFTSI